MILARSHASTSLTNKGERPRVYDATRFNKREAKRLEKIFETIIRFIFTRKVAEARLDVQTTKINEYPNNNSFFLSRFSQKFGSLPKKQNTTEDGIH